MKQEAQNLRERVTKLKRELTEAEKEIDTIVRTCHHQYGETVYEPVYTPAYTIPGDPPGTMGVDRQFPCHVPAKTEKKWKRECQLCGDVQYTTRARPAGYEPDFGGRR